MSCGPVLKSPFDAETNMEINNDDMTCTRGSPGGGSTNSLSEIKENLTRKVALEYFFRGE